MYKIVLEEGQEDQPLVLLGLSRYEATLPQVLNYARHRQRELIPQVERAQPDRHHPPPVSASRRGRNVRLIETIGG